MATVRYARPPIIGEIPSDRHAVIEASAGTGKTYALEHMVVDLLVSTECPIEQILVVTFTEKATAELRARIRRTLQRIVSGEPREPAEAEEVIDLGNNELQRLRVALHSFDRAPIYTIHSFCQRVLSELAFDAGVPFALEVVEHESTFRRALRSELRTTLATNEACSKLLEEWLQSQDAEKLINLLLEGSRRLYLDSGTPDQNRRSIEHLFDGFDEKHLRHDYISAPTPSRDRLDAALNSLTALHREARGDYEYLVRGLVAFDFDVMRNLGYKTSKSKRARAFRAGLSDVTIGFLDRLEACQAALALEMRVLDRFLPLIEAHLKHDKRMRGQIDFHDMLAWVWEGLNGHSGERLVGLLRERYRYGLIDEFQDTDDLQWKIFRRIFLERGEKHFLRVIGDPKQAIYAFRGADVVTYLRAREELKDKGAAVLPLRTNYRSSSAMLEAQSVILRQTATPPFFTGDIKYDDKIECGRDDLRAVDANGKPIVPVTLIRYSPEGGEGKAAGMRQAVGRFIASSLWRVLNEDAHKIRIEEKGKKRREVKPADVFILTRTIKEGIEISAYLREAGVPFAFYKQSGLFQSDEARDVLDVLRAVSDPASTSNRLKAWATPFFSVPLRDLEGWKDLPATHPRLEQLYSWNRLAEARDYGTLFDQLVHGTHLAQREALLADSERELTNYEHILELLLSKAQGRSLSPREIVAFLGDAIAGRVFADDADSNLERLESERSSVQIMTIHKVKGLEADVVCLFGGTHSGSGDGKLHLYHDGFNRRFTLKSPQSESIRAQVTKDEEGEDERLMYVALTRARVKLFLPFLPEESTSTEPDGSYKHINNRLRKMLVEKEFRDQQSDLFEIHDTDTRLRAEAIQSEDLASALTSWRPPEALMEEALTTRDEARLGRFRTRHAALRTVSYTSLGQSRTDESDFSEPEEFKEDIDSTEAEGAAADLGGGRAVGLFLHEVIEKLDLESVAEAPDLNAWRVRPEVKELFEQTIGRRGVRDPRWWERGTEIVFNALRRPIRLGGRVLAGGLCTCASVREMEFIYPIPKSDGSVLRGARNSQWVVERGYVKGFVDLVFEHEGMVYFADWKSDRLPSYEAAFLARHVRRHYELQARIYALGVTRLLGISRREEYENRFGGLLYVFLRGMRAGDAKEPAVYFERPGWEEIGRHAEELGALAAGARWR